MHFHLETIHRACARTLALVMVAALANGCAEPVSVKRVSPRQVQRSLTSSVLTTEELSNSTRNVLRIRDLEERFDKDPAGAIAELHRYAVGPDASPVVPVLFPLAEMSFFHAQQDKRHNRPYYLAAALYAYAYLFPEDPAFTPLPTDPRYRWACDLYNLSLTLAFASADGKYVEPRAGEFELPFGRIAVEFDESSLVWGDRRMTNFLPVAELEVRGLRNRYRRSGIGAPLAAKTQPLDAAHPGKSLVGQKVQVPSTLVLHLEKPRSQLAQQSLHARLDLYTADRREEIVVGDRTVPLESEPTAALASTLTESRTWDRELLSFLGAALPIQQNAIQLGMREPYRPGRIPVVFVHGTGSSVSRWADMVNDLDADPRIRSRYQFWFFTYDSGNPIAYSALMLRRSITDAIAQLDPGGTDACLRQAVVIGHSQGGLLTKMTAIDSGNRFWENISSKPFDEVSLSPDTRELLRDGLFVKPMPEVHRLVFIATPHRGSYLAGSGILRRLIARLVSLPFSMLKLSAELVRLSDDPGSRLSMQRLPTSIDNMAPGHPFIRALSSIPVAPNVPAHSIIPVIGEGDPRPLNDGVVKYSSAHIDGVVSEFVVRSPHSCQSNPDTVNEVQRILLLNLQDSTCAAPAAGSGS